MCDEDVWVPIVVPVTNSNSHFAPEIRKSNFPRDILEFAVVKVQVQFASPQIIRDIEVRPPVAIKVVPRGGKTATRRVIHSGLHCDIRECSVAVVVKQQFSLRRISCWIE